MENHLAFTCLTIGGLIFFSTRYLQYGHLIPSSSSLDFTMAPHFKHW